MKPRKKVTKTDPMERFFEHFQAESALFKEKLREMLHKTGTIP